MNKLVFVLSILILIIASCRSTKKIQTAIIKKDTTAPSSDVNAREDSIRFMQQTYHDILRNHLDYTTFSARINVDYVDADDKDYNVNASLRMYKDSAIWISVNAIFGIEALRVYITRDSVKILDKQNKVYTARSVTYLRDVAALPLGLPTLQDLLVGNPVFLDSNLVSYANSSENISLLSIGDLFKNLLTVTAGDKLLLRSKLDDTDATRNRTCDLTYGDYDDRRGVRFAKLRKISVAEKKKLDIRLEFKQYDFNQELTFPFSIPKNYRRN
ncbi:MAG TPA: DUF4292 domain-containing protein [Chitinophagaceae bacterium]|nr:DUF4292 domain-containing protein [Chitinophagaceae bacterium]